MGEIYKIVIQIEKELDENQVKDLKKLFSNLLKSYNFKSVDLVKKGNNTFTNFYYDLDLEKTNQLRNIFEDIERGVNRRQKMYRNGLVIPIHLIVFDKIKTYTILFFLALWIIIYAIFAIPFILLSTKKQIKKTDFLIKKHE